MANVDGVGSAGAQSAGAQGAVNDVQSRLASLRADLDALQKDLRALAGEVSGVAQSQANEAVNKAQAMAQRARELAEEATAQASRRAFETAEGFEQWAGENADTLRETVREQPLTSLAVAVGVGAFLALLLRR